MPTGAGLGAHRGQESLQHVAIALKLPESFSERCLLNYVDNIVCHPTL